MNLNIVTTFLLTQSNCQNTSYLIRLEVLIDLKGWIGGNLPFLKSFFSKSQVFCRIEWNRVVVNCFSEVASVWLESFKNSASKEGSKWLKMEMWTCLDSTASPRELPAKWVCCYLLKLEILLKVSRRNRKAFGQSAIAQGIKLMNQAATSPSSTLCLWCIYFWTQTSSSYGSLGF